MTGNETSILDQLIQKLGLQGEERLKDKTTELLRLLEIKSSRTGCTINEYAKTIICIDLATLPLGITFDTEIGLKLSGLRKSAYENYKRNFEKILELNKVVGVNEICIQLGLHEYQKKATQFLEIYKKSVADNEDDIDTSHPQYAAMAVYQACKTEKGGKSFKSKLVPYSHLKPAQWSKLEQKWDKLLENYHNKEKKNSKKTTEDQPRKDEDAENQAAGNVKQRIKSLNEVEDYEAWKKRMLEYAYAKLKEKKPK